MKDITILENFFNDEDVEEARQLIDDESLLKSDVCKKFEHLLRSWHFNPGDNCDKRVILDTRPHLTLQHGMKDIIPSVQNYILKILNRIETCMNVKFQLQRVYLNRQVRGQDVTLHTDDTQINAYTLLIYIGDITPENYDKTGGDLEFKDTYNTRIEPFTKRAVLFKGYIPHQAFAPLVPDITRISFAFKFIDTSNELPFSVTYS